MSLNLFAVDVDPGLINDDSTFAVRQAGLVASNNMRPHRGKSQVIGGWEFFSVAALTGICRRQHAWRDNDGNLLVAFGTHSGLFVWSGGEMFDITPNDFTVGNEHGVGGDGFGAGAYGAAGFGASASTGYLADTSPLTWSLQNYGEWLIANARGQKIWVWKNDTAANAVQVVNSPASVQYAVVTPSRQIVAYGCNEETSGDVNPRCIRWCDIEDIEDWTTSATNNAGEWILRNSGQLISAAAIGDYFLVWSDEGVFLQSFLGDPSKTFDFDRLGTGCGIVGPNAAAVLGQTAYWCGTDYRFRMVSIGGAPQVIQSPVDQSFEDSVALVQQDKICLGSISGFNEVWCFYPHKDDGLECSRYLALAVAEEGRWFEGEISRTAWLDAGPYEFPIAAGADGYVYIHERGNSANGAVLSWSMETGDIVLNESGRVLMLREIRPDLHDQQGAAQLTIFGRDTPQGVETAFGPYTLGVGDSYLDLDDAAGAILRLRYSGSAANAFVRMGRPVFDVTTRGRA